jgi:superkiller protein 3
VYSKAGRHAAAIKALHRALELDPSNWLCSFLIGELKCETGLFQEAILIFMEILKQHADELSVLAALAQAYLSLGQAQYREGYHTRAESSFFDSINAALSFIECYSGFGGLAWKVISDATLQLSRQSVLHDQMQAERIGDTLRSLLSVDHGSVHGLPPLADSGSLLFLGISIYACNLRIGLTSSSNAARGSAWYDLAISLRFWQGQSAVRSSEVEKKIVDATTNALREEPTNDLYWNAYGSAHFMEHPKVAQHAYIKALELDSKARDSDKVIRESELTDN